MAEVVIEVDQLEEKNYGGHWLRPTRRHKYLKAELSHATLRTKNWKQKDKNEKQKKLSPQKFSFTPTSTHVQRPYVSLCAIFFPKKGWAVFNNTP